MVKKLLCTIDLGFGESGKVFGYYKDSTVIKLEGGKVRGLDKSPKEIKYMGEDVIIVDECIELQDGTRYPILKNYG